MRIGGGENTCSHVLGRPANRPEDFSTLLRGAVGSMKKFVKLIEAMTMFLFVLSIFMTVLGVFYR